MQYVRYLPLLSVVFSTIFVGNIQAQANDKTHYRVMVDPYAPPFAYTNPQSKSVVGFDLDVLNAIAAQEKFALTVIPHPWQGLFATLDDGSSDIISSGISITAERSKIMSFSNPYFESRQVLLFNPKIVALQNPGQITDLRIAVEANTTSDALIKKINSVDKIVRVNSVYAAIKSMLMKKSDLVLGDLGVISYYKNKFSDVGLKTLSNPDWATENYGFAVKKGNTELLNKLNDGLKYIKANGIYDKIYKKWFSE